jgi:iron(III) transport system ATP-binding protein
VAEFLGSANLIEGEVRGFAAGVCSVATAHGQLRIRWEGSASVGDRVVVSIRSELIALEPSAGHNGANRWPGTIRTRAFRGDSVEHLVGVGGVELRVRTEPAATVAPGTEVTVRLPEEGPALIRA